MEGKHEKREGIPLNTWKRKAKGVLLLVLLAAFLVSGGMLLRDMIRSDRENKANQSLAREVRQAREEAGRQKAQAEKRRQEAPAAAGEEEEEWSPYAQSGVLRQYDSLWQRNPDMAGWLSVPGMAIDYPIMNTPDDPEHYLRRGFDGKYAASGCLFLGADWTPEGNCAIIYGHFMRDGSMFGTLNQYESEEFAREHPVIRFDTLTEEREYQVIGAFYSQVYTVEDTGVFRYYQYTDLSGQEKFEEYAGQVKAACLYDLGIEAEWGDRILTLSTCSYHTDNGRFVVVAVEKAAGDSTVGETPSP